MFLKFRIIFYRVMQNICHLNVTTAHVFSNIKGQEIDIQNYIPGIEDIVVLTVKPHSPEGKQKQKQKLCKTKSLKNVYDKFGKLKNLKKYGIISVDKKN